MIVTPTPLYPLLMRRRVQTGERDECKRARLTVPNSHPLATSEANQIVMTAVFDLKKFVRPGSYRGAGVHVPFIFSRPYSGVIATSAIEQVKLDIYRSFSQTSFCTNSSVTL